MTRDEAKRECERLASEHPDRERNRWLPRENPDGSWDVVRVGLPPADGTLQAETRADEKPSTADDPRSAAFRNLGPNIGPGI